jgi:hypothetical protein
MPSLEITTQIGCPLMCTFCPQDKLNKAYRDPIRKMTIETFETVLKKLTPDYRIIFAGYTDQLLCKSCNDAHCHTPWNNKKVYEIVLKQDPEFKLCLHLSE